MVTKKEAAILLSIARSEYRGSSLSEAVWTFDLDVAGEVSPKAVGGVLVSLQKKGLVKLDDGEEHGMATLTDKGIAELPADERAKWSKS